MARTKDNQANKAYLIQQPPEPRTPAKFVQVKHELAPRFLVFGYGGWSQLSGLQNSFNELSAAHTGAHIHGVCHLSEQVSHFVGHRAYPKEERVMSVSANGFHHFLMALPTTLSSMLPLYRLGRGFDHVDLSHYDLDRVLEQA